ncbi:hypothetical protein D3C79_831000 [compost metagenome]
MLHIGTQRTPQAVDQSQGGRVGFGQRREDHLVPTEQGGVRGLYPALLGTGDRVAGDEARQALTALVYKNRTRLTDDITLGTADIGNDRIAQVEPGQEGQDFFHGQDRHGQLDDIGTDTGCGEVFFAAVDHAQGHGLLARGGIQVDTDHFAAQAAFTQALGERATDQAEADHDQAVDDWRGFGFCCIYHWCEPCSEIWTAGKSHWGCFAAPTTSDQSTAFG